MNKLHLECLEERIVPDGNGMMLPPPLPTETIQANFDFNSGTLTVTGTDGEDNVEIERVTDPILNTDNVKVWGNGVLRATVDANSIHFVNVNLKGGDDKFSCDYILTNGLWVSGGAGKDNLSSYIKATLDGGDGDDTISGSNSDDVIWGGDGNDVIIGKAGNDIISGGNDNDSIEGGAGNDLIWGDNGNDTISGNEGADKIYGGAGDDVLSGNYLPTVSLNNETDTNEVYGGDGNDILYSNGVLASSLYYGESGNDTIHGETLNGATLDGGTGNDVIYSNLNISATNYINVDDFDADAISTSGFDVIDDDIFDIYF
jgi:Ca2+-binding RTX toxin-like protein